MVIIQYMVILTSYFHNLPEPLHTIYVKLSHVLAMPENLTTNTAIMGILEYQFALLHSLKKKHPNCLIFGQAWQKNKKKDHIVKVKK